eukprot:CAMPEP_0195527232 /NCGR_PEP_ID=MMETSP0794_2-20130614/28764_1 /TAXON_ID=515487 /ORGANISM="Stephanopyxis turris, Strain CCMP 815" /LENGTH=286 /DNA_ID=CAMNT_0040658097 /DNA_START=58 /DNA_END=918 /DNA_ORIENTATION=+
MKENANPTIHAVRKQITSSDERTIGHSAISRFSGSGDSSSNNFALFFDDNDNSENCSSVTNVHTPGEKAVFLALNEIVSNGSLPVNGRTASSLDDCVGILRQAGFLVDPTSTLHVTKPLFMPMRKITPGSPAPAKEACSVNYTLVRSEDHDRNTFDREEVFDMIRTINDPEHPLTLEQLNVVNPDDLSVVDSLGGKSEVNALSSVEVKFTPTIPHCSMATLIGLCIRVKLIRSLPSRFKVTVMIKPGTHASELAVNKQLSDKERVAAALENAHLLGVVNKCISRLE